MSILPSFNCMRTRIPIFRNQTNLVCTILFGTVGLRWEYALSLCRVDLKFSSTTEKKLVNIIKRYCKADVIIKLVFTPLKISTYFSTKDIVPFALKSNLFVKSVMPHKLVKLHDTLPSQVYLSLFGFSVFAFTLDICFRL